MISINIKPFARYREIIGEKDIVMNLPEGSSVSDLITDLVNKYPYLKPIESKIVVAVNYEYQDHDHLLRSNDEVALIPPVSGGN
ncbi:MAG: molybdopterin synthase sulfur carrier subunit [Dehalococcoidia bacterium]|nr:molybdopterin synthase sulfur carrier subunit [Dehalococcoidia bacterium]MQG16147.1 MoaD/ThiS family protein [SAR202 cluster bacterium]|tara:strand:- start:4468 stop:4719 length:252 start_codon:yes stop_codon:yes gene_type:complete